jgi:hypothetical protein
MVDGPQALVLTSIVIGVGEAWLAILIRLTGPRTLDLRVLVERTQGDEAGRRAYRGPPAPMPRR